MAKYKSGRNSSNNWGEAEDALMILKVAYMLLEMCPSGYYDK